MKFSSVPLMNDVAITRLEGRSQRKKERAMSLRSHSYTAKLGLVELLFHAITASQLMG